MPPDGSVAVVAVILICELFSSCGKIANVIGFGDGGFVSWVTVTVIVRVAGVGSARPWASVTVRVTVKVPTLLN